MRKILHITTHLLLILFAADVAVAVPSNDNIILNKLRSVKGDMPSTTYTMEIDKYGFAWIGSRDGLFRYDGYDIVSLESLTQNGALSNVWNVYENGDRLIVKSTEGLFTLSLDDYVLTPVDGLEDVGLKQIYKRPDGGFLLGTDNGILKLNGELNIEGSLGVVDGLSHGIVRAIYVDNDGSMWAGTYDGLNKIDGESGEVSVTRFLKEGSTRNDLILSIVPDSEDDDTIFWLGTESGLVKFNRLNGEYKKWSSRNSTISHSAIKPIVRVDNKLWLGSGLGLNIFDIEKESFTSYLHNPDRVNTISSNQVHKIWTDSSNTTWIVTNNGVNYVNHDSRHVRHIPITYLERGVETSTSVRSVIRSLSDGLWVTTSEGMFYYDNELKLDKSMSAAACKRLPVADCSDIIRDRYGRLWVGTLQGLVIYDSNTERSILVDTNTTELFESNYISRIINNHKGYMFVSEWRGGITRIPEDYGVDNLEISAKRICEYGATCIEILNDQLWIANGGRLIRISTETMSEEEITPVMERLDGESIESMFLNDGVIYCGTKGEIVTYDIETKRCGAIKMNNPDRHIINITKDGYGNIWASDDRMLVRITSSGRIVQFPVDAYSTMQIITKASMKLLGNGDIALGGDNGFILFSPEKMGVSVSDERLAITYIDVNNRRLFIDEGQSDNRVVLNHNEHNITIGFTSLNYSNTRLSNYRYRLKGIDADWNYISSDRNYAIYTNLPAGEYLFELCCDNASGEWRSEPLTLTVVVKSHILLSRFFIALYIFLFFAAIIAVLYFYAKHLRLLSDLKVSNVEREYVQEMAKSKASFFTNLSHEIRTPLNLITPTIKKVLHDPSLGEESHKLLLLAEENSNRLLRLLNQLLDFRDTQNGDKSPLKLRRNDLKQIAMTIFSSYESQANERSIEYRLHVDESPVVFCFDRDKMESIIYNLLSNAFKYTPREGCISLMLKIVDGNVVIEVRNSGVGIAAAELPHIFEKFYRAEYFRDRSEGAGIGLSIVSEFVELHKGEIDVESVPNDYTMFRVAIPFVEATIDSPREEMSDDKLRIIEEFEEAVNQRSDKSKVLYVDDNSQILEMISIILSSDYNVITATNGLEGFEKCKRYRPDIVITDIMMPGTDGIDLCKMIKSTPEVADIPIIAMTAKSQISDQIVGVNAGVDSYLTKPINVELIHATIEQLLRRSDEHKRQLKEVNGLYNEEEMTSQDRQFMERVMEVIHANLSDPQLSVEQIAETLSVSNASLYRKVKQLSGVSTNELIKKVRLNRANVLMQHNYGSLSEIAYKVGFSSPSYFSKCYKTEFGCTPRDTKS